MTNIKAVILDWAGTSVDYGCMGPARVFVEVFSRFNMEVTLDQARIPMGLAKKDHTRVILEMPEVMEQWNAIYGKQPQEKDVEEIYSSLEPAMADIIKDFATPVPGLLGFMDKIRSFNIKVGTTTGYVAGMMEKLVPEAKKQGFSPDCIVSSSEVPVGRPAPYMCYLNAIKLHAYPFSHMIKIGDTVADIQEGINAGMWTIGLTKSGNEVGMSFDEINEADPFIVNKLIEKAGKKLRCAGAHYIAEGIWDCNHILEEINSRIKSKELPSEFNRSHSLAV